MLGIVDVGGGTRGIFGAGVFDFCMDKGIKFDYVIGVSAGSANGASYLAGQRGRNIRFYDEYAFRKEYMSPMLFLRTGQYLDLDYIYSTLSNSDGEDPLDYEAFAANPADFEIVTTDARRGRPFYFGKSDIGKDSYDCIKASCAVPVVCEPYMVYGRPYYDGGISDPIPYKRAFERGCDRLVVILTKPKTAFRTPEQDVRMARLIRRRYPAAAECFATRSRTYNDSLREILELEEQGRLLIVAPDSIGELKTLTLDHTPLRVLYTKGYRSGALIEEYLSR